METSIRTRSVELEDKIHEYIDRRVGIAPDRSNRSIGYGRLYLTDMNGARNRG